MLTRRERLRKAVKTVQNRLRRSAAPAIPVFLFGEMRSGTNMLTECFDRTPGTAVFNENDEAAFDCFELRSLEVIRALIGRSRASYVFFKAIADSGRAVELLTAFPGSRAIWIFRRHQDVVNSALRRFSYHREHLRVVLEERERAGWRSHGVRPEHEELIRKHYGPSLSETSARGLIWYLRNDLFYTQGLDTRRDVLLVNYERLVRHPSAELARAFAFLRLEFNRDAFRHVSTESVGKNPDPEIEPEIAALCETLFARLQATRG